MLNLQSESRFYFFANSFGEQISKLKIRLKMSLISVFFNEIKVLSSSISVELKHVGRMANDFIDFLAKQGVDRSFPFVAMLL